MKCDLCGKEIELDDRHIFVLVQGYQRPGRGVSGRSGSSIVLRELVPDRGAHAGCIVLKQDGITPGQRTLI